MRCFFVGAVALALVGMFSAADAVFGQELLKTKGWGSLSGKVTLEGDLPIQEDFTAKMTAHADKACCLAGKASEKADQTWIVNSKNRGIANVVIWLKAPKDTYLPTHDKYKVRKDKVILDQPHCAFVPRVVVFNPFYIDQGKEISTGQEMIIKNSAVVNHNVRAIGHPEKNPGFNNNLPAGAEYDATKKFKPQPLPISIQCDVHPWMAAKVFVFDNPYYAITDADGNYEMPIVPAGTTVSIIGYHEGIGWALGKTPDVRSKFGREMTIQEGKNTLDFKLQAPK